MQVLRVYIEVSIYLYLDPSCAPGQHPARVLEVLWLEQVS